MLGYVQIHEDSISDMDFSIYQSRHCSICKEIGKEYGQIFRPFLSFEVTLVALLLESQFDPDQDRDFHCGLKCHIQTRVRKEIMEYCAFLNLYLILLKLEDDLIDQPTFIKRKLHDLLLKHTRFQRKLSLYAERMERLEGLMAAIRKEEAKKADREVLLDLFGNYFAELLWIFYDLHPGVSADPSLLQLGYGLGWWIYLIDAFDDFEKDEKAGQFNLLAECKDRNLYVQRMHEQLLDGFSWLLQDLRYPELLENILLDGCESTYQKIRKKKISLKTKGV